jgi:phage terminase Nu1 subunit (DNA packaging protein)
MRCLAASSVFIHAHAKTQATDMETTTTITRTQKTIMTHKEIAAHFRVSERTVTTWAHMGLPRIYIGSIQTPRRGAHPRYDLAKVSEWLKNRNASKERSLV